MISSYPSIYNLGHAAIADLFKGPVIIEEKIDGSQISFRRHVPLPADEFDQPVLEVRSKGAMVNTVAPEGMFKKAVDFLKSIEEKIPTGFTFRGEYLSKPKHNMLAYDREPKNNIIVFDVNNGEESYIPIEEKCVYAESIDLECVPALFTGIITDVTMLRSFFDRESILGGQKIEGMVIKPAKYDLFGRDKKVLMGKFVSEAFKEVHSNEWKKEHGTPSNGEIVQLLGAQYGTPARWQKALIHAREAGTITDSLKDIGMLMAEVPNDILKECETEIRDKLFAWAWPQLRRIVARGLPQWYKDELAKKQFEPTVNENKLS